MTRIREWLDRMWTSPLEREEKTEARARLEVDTKRVERSAERIETSAAELEDRVFVENHISASIKALITRKAAPR